MVLPVVVRGLADQAAGIGSVRRHKFNARRTIVDNIGFDSKAEAMRYLVNKARVEAGEISDLKLQPAFELQPAFRDAGGKRHRAISYVADFEYTEGERRVVEDVKGFETKTWRLKKKLFLYRYPEYELRIVR